MIAHADQSIRQWGQQQATADQRQPLGNADISPGQPTPSFQDDLTDHVTKAVGRYPLASIVAATVLGVAAGWIVKRKL